MPRRTDHAETVMPNTSHPRGGAAASRTGGRDLGSAESTRPGTPALPRPSPPGSRSPAHSPDCAAPLADTGAMTRIHWRGPGVTAPDALGRRPAATASAPARVSHSQPRADEWPLQSYLELGALPGAVPCARLHAKQVLWEWGLSAFSENAELLLSELVTNAIQVSLSAERILPVRLWLSSDRSRLLIQVQDTNHCPPARTGADDQDESGRGLLIVDAISTKWGWRIKEDHRGKIVWAVIE